MSLSCLVKKLLVLALVMPSLSLSMEEKEEKKGRVATMEPLFPEGPDNTLFKVICYKNQFYGELTPGLDWNDVHNTPGKWKLFLDEQKPRDFDNYVGLTETYEKVRNETAIESETTSLIKSLGYQKVFIDCNSDHEINVTTTQNTFPSARKFDFSKGQPTNLNSLVCKLPTPGQQKKSKQVLSEIVLPASTQPIFIKNLAVMRIFDDQKSLNADTHHGTWRKNTPYSKDQKALVAGYISFIFLGVNGIIYFLRASLPKLLSITYVAPITALLGAAWYMQKIRAGNYTAKTRAQYDKSVEHLTGRFNQLGQPEEEDDENKEEGDEE